MGGGFFGCRLALHLRRFLPSVLLLEESPGLLTRASFNNQARVHQGYHYPHSLLTALRSRVNFMRFTEEYADCVDSSFEKYYAISRDFSSVTAAQFKAFCLRIGAPLEPASAEVRSAFSTSIEDVFLVREYAFDASKLRSRLDEQLRAAGVEVRCGVRAVAVEARAGGHLSLSITSGEKPACETAARVFNCTYSALNRLLSASSLPLIPLKHEGTEIALVEPPSLLMDKGVTVMCGPFFSVMPFPALGKHSLSHVRYTPHCSWIDDVHTALRPPWTPPQGVGQSAFDRMIRDARRYMPCLSECKQAGSLWETKTVLPASEVDDGRPILFRAHHGVHGLYCVLGGKIDNVYDVEREIDDLRARGQLQ